MGSLWNRSGTIERYADDLKADGAQAFFFQGGTTTPLTVYRNSGESSAFPHPVVADANGRWPDVFVPYITSFDVQVQSKDDVQLTFSLQIPNPDPVELTVTVDPLNTVQTGMIHAELTNSTKNGYVRLNGRTISKSAASGSERANDDTLALFNYLWNLPDAIAPVSGGRGASGAADHAAGKTITLPSFQGAMPIGLDDMGNTAAGAFAGLAFSPGSAIIAGSKTGTNTFALAIANLPAHSHTGTTEAEGAHIHTGTTGNQSADHTHSGTTAAGTAHTHADNLSIDSGGAHQHLIVSQTASVGGLTAVNTISLGAGYGNTLDYTLAGIGNAADRGLSGSAGAHTHTLTGDIQAESAHTHTFTTGNVSANHNHGFTTGAGTSHSHTFTTSAQGSGTAFNNLGRVVTVTWFIKL